MITRRGLVGLGMLSISGAAIGASQARDDGSKTMSDRDLIAAAIDTFVAAYNAGDLARVIGYYAEDLIKDRQGAAAESKKETEERIARVFRDSKGQLSVSNDEIVTSGDLAYTRGTLKVTLTSRAGGPPQLLERRFLEIWRKRDGQWLVARTMDNSGAPAGA